VHVPSEDVGSGGRWFGWNSQQVHLNLIEGPTPFAVVAAWASSHQIIPGVLSTQTSRDDVIHCQVSTVLPTILADVIVSAQDLTLGEADTGAGAAHHLLQTDN